MIKEIVIDEEKLSQECEQLPIEVAAQVVQDLLDTAEHLDKIHKEALLARPGGPLAVAGLAANQIGYPYRAFVIKNGQGILVPILNPKIAYQGKGKSHGYESCFSRPGKKAWKSRFKKISLYSADPNAAHGISYHPEWRPQSKPGLWTFRNFYARVVQHEMDHFEGILI